MFLGYVLHHTRGRPVKVDQVVNLILWQVRETLKGGDKAYQYQNQVSFLAAFAVVYGLYDLRCGGQTTLFMATAYNAFQVKPFLDAIASPSSQ